MLTMQDFVVVSAMLLLMALGALVIGYGVGQVASRWIGPAGPWWFLGCVVCGAFVAGVGCGVK